MKHSKLARSLVAIITIAAISAPAIATAEEEVKLKGRSVKVTYADLNLEKEAGTHVLYRRLQQASKRACGVESFQNAGSVSAMSDSKRCYRVTLTAAIEKIDNKILTRIHEG